MKMTHLLATLFDMHFDCGYSFVGYIYVASHEIFESKNTKLNILWTQYKYSVMFDFAVSSSL